MAYTYQYVVTGANPPMFYLEDKEGDGYRHPVAFTNPAKQAPWLPSLTPDPSIPLKPGEKERGYFELDVPPTDFLMGKKPDKYTKYAEIYEDTVLECWDGLLEGKGTARDCKGLYFPFDGSAFISKESRLYIPDILAGTFHFGVCEILGDVFVGDITFDGGVHVSESQLDGNITITAPLTLDTCNLYGNIAIDFGVHAKTHKEHEAPDFETFYLEDITFTLKKSELWRYFRQNRNWNAACDVWEATHTLAHEGVRHFCLDTVNHIENCKCGLFIPFYLGLHPAAIQYFGLVDKRKPALLPESHPVSGTSLSLLEDTLFKLMNMWDEEWGAGGGFADCIYAWEEMLGEKYPDFYEEWRAGMVEITGVDPETYLPE